MNKSRRTSKENPFDFATSNNVTPATTTKDDLLEIQRQAEISERRDEFQFAEPRLVSHR